MRVEAVKLAQAGFGNFLAGTCVNRLKEKRDGNKEGDFIDTICNSAGHRLIENIKVWKLKWLWE